MANTSINNKCCAKTSNIIELDGCYVCTYSGMVQDAPCFGYEFQCRDDKVLLKNSLLDEFCHRLAVDTRTQADSESLYNDSVRKNPNIQKLKLLACSLYIACKRNSCPRTMKEISAVSGVDMKQIAQYEHLVCTRYYPTKPSDYADRFGSKLQLNYKQITKIHQELLKVSKSKYTDNPINVCAAAIYKTMRNIGVDIKQLEDITGIPSSTIKRLSKNIYGVYVPKILHLYKSCLFCK